MSSLLGTLTVLISASTVGFAKAAREIRMIDRAAAASTASIATGAKNANSALMSVGRTLTQFVTLPLGLLGISSAKTFAEFEFNIAKVTGLVGIATDQTKLWADEILNLSAAVGKGPVELSDALYFITSSGFKTAEAMDILTVSAKAASAGLGDTQVVANVVTSALNAYKQSNLSAAEATDVLVNTVREGKAEADKMVASMGVILPISSKLGVSFNEVGAGMAAMTRTGSTAATSAVQLRQIMFALLKPAQHSRDALEQMGTSAANLRKILREDGLLALMMEIKRLIDTFGEETAAEIFPNIRALSGTLEIIGENLEANKAIFGSLEKSTGMLDAAFEAVSDTLKFQFTQTGAEASAMLVKFGEGIAKVLIPVLNVLQDVFKNVGDWFAGLSDETQKFIVKAAGIAVVLGPLLALKAAFASMKMFVANFGALSASVAESTLALKANTAAKAQNNAATATGIPLGQAMAIAKAKETIAVEAAAKAQVDSVVANYEATKSEMVLASAVSMDEKAYALSIRTKQAHTAATLEANAVSKAAALELTAANQRLVVAQRQLVIAQRAQAMQSVAIGNAQRAQAAASNAATTAVEKEAIAVRTSLMSKEAEILARKTAIQVQIAEAEVTAANRAVKAAEARATMTLAKVEEASAVRSALTQKARAARIASVSKVVVAAQEAEAVAFATAARAASLKNSSFLAYTGGSFLLANSQKLTKAMVVQNATMVATSATTKVLTGVSLALNNVWKLMAANPWTSLFLLAGGIYLIYKQATKLNAVQQTQKDLTDKIAESTAAETAQLNSYLGVAKNAYVSSDLRAQSIKKLNDLAPTYLSWITQENVNTQQATDAINSYNVALKEKYRLQAAQEQLTEVEKAYAKSVIDGSNKQLSTWQLMKVGFLAMSSSRKQTVEQIQRLEKENADEAKTNYEKSKKYLLDQISDRRSATTALKAEFNAIATNVSNIINKNKEYTEITKKTGKERIEAIKNFSTTYAEKLARLNGKDEAGLIKEMGDTQQSLILETTIELERILNQLEKEKKLIIQARGRMVKEASLPEQTNGKVIDYTKQFKGILPHVKTDQLGEVDTMIKNTLDLLKELNLIKVDVDTTETNFKIKEFFAGIKDEFESLERKRIVLNMTEDEYNAEKLSVYAKALGSIADQKAKDVAINTAYVKGLQANHSVLKGLAIIEAQRTDDTERLITQFEAQMEVEEQARQKTEDLQQALATAAAMAGTFDLSLQGLTNSSYDSKVELEQLEKELKGFEKIRGLLEIIPDLNNVQMFGILPMFGNLAQALDKLKAKFKDFTIGEIFKDMDADMADAGRKSLLFGEYWDGNARKLEEYQNTLQAAMRVNTELFTPEQWATYSKNVDALILKIQELTTSDRIMAFGQEIQNMASAIGSLFSTITSAMEDGSISFAESMNIIAQSASALIPILGALAAAEIIQNEAATKGAIGVLTAIAGLALLAGTWATFVNKDKYSAGMAEGGIVPPGYPNDSYPAKLTSGEMVIPPNKLPEFTKKMNVTVKVEGIVKGKDLHYLVKEVERRYQNSH